MKISMSESHLGHFTDFSWYFNNVEIGANYCTFPSVSQVSETRFNSISQSCKVKTAYQSLLIAGYQSFVILRLAGSFKLFERFCIKVFFWFYFIVLFLISSLNRFPRNVFRQHEVCNCWTWQIMGLGTILRTLNMCRVRRHSSKVIFSFIFILIKLLIECINLFSFEDCLSWSKTADLCPLPMTSANSTRKLPTKQLLSPTAVPNSSAKLERS